MRWLIFLQSHFFNFSSPRFRDSLTPQYKLIGRFPPPLCLGCSLILNGETADSSSAAGAVPLGRVPISGALLFASY